MMPLKPTSRQVGALYAGWQWGTERTRELIVQSPQIYLQAQATRGPAPPSGTQRSCRISGPWAASRAVPTEPSRGPCSRNCARASSLK